jgi:sphingomyelin phosphodiesterase acid-like 3
MFHIPPGIDGFSTMVQYRRMTAGPQVSVSTDICNKAIVPMWKPVWTARLEKIMQDYQSTIMVTFAGHDHTDDFRILHAGQAGGEFVLIDPPVSPIYGQNPSFRVVTVEQGGGLADQSTYYLTNLQAARSDVPGKWMKEYSFAEEWQSHPLNASSLKSVYDRIRTDPKARARWLTLLNVSSSHDTVPANGVDSLDCAVAALDPASYQACYCPAPVP